MKTVTIKPFKVFDAPPMEGRGRSMSYPFSAMEVGQAFDAPRDMGDDKRGKDRRATSLRVASYQWAKRRNPTAKFTVRLIDENTVRCRRDA